jgi:hypothetical protein
MCEDFPGSGVGDHSVLNCVSSSEESLMSVVCGLDLHRGQITFDAVDTASGEVWRGRVWQPDRERFRRWLTHDVARRANGRPVAMAVEGCTGWRYVIEEIVAAGFEAHLAEPADTQAARGRKRHAKTDRSDSRLLRELLQSGDLPESWIPPTVVLEWRERVRLYKSLVDQRSMWAQRIHAELFQHGVAVAETAIRSAAYQGVADGRRDELEPGGAAADPSRIRHARGRRRRGAVVEGGTAAIRSSSTGLSGVGRGQLRDRWVDRGGGLVRARRLSSVLPLRTGRTPHGIGRQRGRLRSAPGQRPSGSSHDHRRNRGQPA